MARMMKSSVGTMMLRFLVLVITVGQVSAVKLKNPFRRYMENAYNPEDLEKELTHSLNPRHSESNTFLPGPNDEVCILDERDIDDPFYEYFDENGWCCCSLCKPGHYVKRFCQCSSLPDMPLPSSENDTKCVHVKRGLQFMDKHNKCTVPYTCKTSCRSHQRKVSDCTPRADLTCECEDGWYNPDPTDDGPIPRECLPKPRCPAGEEPRRIRGSSRIELVCRPCKRGFFKVDGDSTDSCKPHRVCENKPGTATSDSECLNNDLLQQHSTLLPSPTSGKEQTSTSVSQRELEVESKVEMQANPQDESPSTPHLDGSSSTPHPEPHPTTPLKGDSHIATEPQCPKPAPCEYPWCIYVAVVSVLFTVLALVACACPLDKKQYQRK